MARRYWLMKSEPRRFRSRTSLARRRRPRAGTACATTRRATCCATRSQVGDGVLFYHSSADPPAAVAGTADGRARRLPGPDAVRPKSSHYDPEASATSRAGSSSTSSSTRSFRRAVTLPELRATPGSGRHGAAAQGQPPVGAAGDARRVEDVVQAMGTGSVDRGARRSTTWRSRCGTSAAAERFYCETLGLRVLRRWPARDGAGRALDLASTPVTARSWRSRSRRPRRARPAERRPRARPPRPAPGRAAHRARRRARAGSSASPRRASRSRPHGVHALRARSRGQPRRPVALAR